MTYSTKVPPMIGVLIGVSLYEISDTVLYLIQPLIIPTFLRVVGMVVTLYYLTKASYHRMSGQLSGLFSFMIIWTVFMLLRGSLVGNFIPGGPYDLLSILRHSVLNSFGAATFLIPLVALITFNPRSLYYIRKYAVFFCLSALVMTYIGRDQIAYGQLTNGMTTIEAVDGSYISVRNLIHAAYPGFGLILFALFCNGYISNNLFKILFPIAIFVFFVVMAIGGGRGDTIYGLVYLLSFFYLMTRYPVVIGVKEKNKKIGKFARKLTGIILGVGFVFLLSYLYTQTEVFDYVLERAFGGKTLSTNIQSESRDQLVRDFITDFNAHPLDWVWGRGVNGSYATQHLGIEGRRAWMEWGYLYLVLKGGIVYLTLFVVSLLHAAYLGLMKSRNVLSKGMAFLCLVLLFALSSTNAEPQFSTQFVLTWICFGLVERREVRMMSDEDIYGYFNVKNYKA